jgi:hypothetical protein
MLTRPLHDGMTFNIDSAPSGSPRELGVLPRCERNTGLAVELFELLENDGTRGHVDAECERFSGEHHFDEFALKEFFDNLFERGQKPGVVGGNTPLESFEPFPVTQDAEVLVE